jgi:hypothetical protein
LNYIPAKKVFFGTRDNGITDGHFSLCPGRKDMVKIKKH